MTRYREKLEKIPCVDREMAEHLIQEVEQFQERCLSDFGTRFAFLSDEFYCICGREMPEEEIYEGYPQIENGVGLIRQFEDECEEAYREISGQSLSGPLSPVRIVIPTGVSVAAHIEKLCARYAPDQVHTEVIPVINRFFGESITVTGLIVGQDLLHALEGKEFDEVLISESMLRENTECFLDDMTLEDVRKKIGKPVRIVENTGESFIRALYLLEDYHE